MFDEPLTVGTKNRPILEPTPSGNGYTRSLACTQPQFVPSPDELALALAFHRLLHLFLSSR